MYYRYGILRSDVSVKAEAHNNSLLGKHTLGIEIAIPEFAARCGLGNINLQHSKSPHSSCSAIEEALTAPLPPKGSRLVTIRPDKDSFGAMAVLTLRAENRNIDRELVIWIGLVDSMGFHNAKKVRPDLAYHYDSAQSAAIQVISDDEISWWPKLEEKISAIVKIISGKTTLDEIRSLASINNRSSADFPVKRYGKVALITAPRQYKKARS